MFISANNNNALLLYISSWSRSSFSALLVIQFIIRLDVIYSDINHDCGVTLSLSPHQGTVFQLNIGQFRLLSL